MEQVKQYSRKYALAITSIILLLSGTVVAVYLAQRPTSFEQKAAVTLPNTVYAEAPERAFGPDKRFYDGPFATSINQGQLKAYVNSAAAGSGTTRLFKGSSIDSLADTGIVVIGKGTAFDSDGAWLMTPSYLSPTSGKTVGWYHAETHNSNPYQIKSVGYAESTDNGDAFTKPNYPNNQVVTADQAFQNDPTSNERNESGDFKVIPFPASNPQYYYMYFQATRDSDRPNQSSWTTHLARAAISSDGKPGTWYKYYQGSFSQPGLGGKSNSLATEGGTSLSKSWVSFDRDINKYIGVDDYWDYVEVGVGGTLLNMSSDGIHFQRINPYPFTLMDTKTQSYYYGSLIGLDGNPNEVGNTFYLYRSYIPPGSDAVELNCTDSNCYSARYKVTLKTDTALGAINNFNKIKFNKYQSSDGQDDWDTTGATFYGRQSYGVDYAFKQDLGYLLTTAAAGSSALYSCYIDGWKDHMLVATPDGCTNATYIEKIGYTVPANTPGARAIYRCYSSAKTNHYTSLSNTCDGNPSDFEFLVGYSFFPGFILTPTNTPRPTPTRTPTPSPTGTPTPTPTHGITPGVTATITPSPTRGITPTPTQPGPTSTPIPGHTNLRLTLSLQGIGNSATSGANMSPLNQQRDSLVQVFNSSNQQVGSDLSGRVTYDQSTGLFTGIVDAGNLSTGVYIVKVKSDRYLRKLIPGIQTITKGITNILPQASLTVGDVNGDNFLDIIDYNLLSSCFGEKQQTAGCTTPETADLDDNGVVDGVDYNYLIRNMSMQTGD